MFLLTLRFDPQSDISPIVFDVLFFFGKKAHVSPSKSKAPPQPEGAPLNTPPWMQQPWLPPQSAQQQQWMMGQPNPWMPPQQYPAPWMQPQQYPGPWMQSSQATAAPQHEGPTGKSESEARAARRAHKKEVEEAMDARRASGQKPQKVRVKAGGGIDGGCEGKNEFDEALRSLVPRILDVSCVSWIDQSPSAIERLRAALDKEFEYVGNPLSDRGFKNVVKRQMKTERSKMKAWFLGGKKECPVYIEPDQWARLCEYWSKPETEQKAVRMANARKAVKNQSNVGRARKAGKEALLVCVMLSITCTWIFLPSISDYG
jgi:hypothetical protein